MPWTNSPRRRGERSEHNRETALRQARGFKVLIPDLRRHRRSRFGVSRGDLQPRPPDRETRRGHRQPQRRSGDDFAVLLAHGGHRELRRVRRFHHRRRRSDVGRQCTRTRRCCSRRSLVADSVPGHHQTAGVLNRRGRRGRRGLPAAGPTNLVGPDERRERAWRNEASTDARLTSPRSLTSLAPLSGGGRRPLPSYPGFRGSLNGRSSPRSLHPCG